MAEPDLQLDETTKGYMTRPYSFFKKPLYPNGGRKLSRVEIMLYGAIFSLSGVNKKGEEFRCNKSYDRFAADFNCAHSTIARRISALKEAGLIDQDKSHRWCASYECTSRTKETGYIKTEFYLYHTKFNIRGEDEPRYLTNAEIDVLSLIKTHCSNAANSGVFTGSVRGIMKTLSLSKTTVQKAITTLLRAGLIFRTGENRGVNGHKRSLYTVNARLLRRTEKNYVRDNAVQPSRRALSSAEKAADARTERERYYSDLRNRAQNRVDFFLGKLNEDATYRQIEADLRPLTPKIALAELQHLPELKSLRREETRLKAERAKRMAELGISEEDLIPKYQCAKCSDTGFLPNGRMCQCYPPGRRRP